MFERKKPGRYCPLNYYYKPEELTGDDTCEADILYVVGGLYGNPFALDTFLSRITRESAQGASVTVVFNGDFHWLDIAHEDFAAVDAWVAEHWAIQGNVEAELVEDDPDAGCGCAYPDYVSDFVVERSNELMRHIKTTASAHPVIRRQLARLPKTMTARVGTRRIGIVHGDAYSLAGWNFAVEQMPPEGERTKHAIAMDFLRSDVGVFACTHTGLPFLQAFDVDDYRCAIINNGSAGLPCFRDSSFGVVTRISSYPQPPEDTLYGCNLDGIRLDAVPVAFDNSAWLARLRANWSEGSPARDLYERRIEGGPNFRLRDAMRA